MDRVVVHPLVLLSVVDHFNRWGPAGGGAAALSHGPEPRREGRGAAGGRGRGRAIARVETLRRRERGPESAGGGRPREEEKGCSDGCGPRTGPHGAGSSADGLGPGARCRLCSAAERGPLSGSAVPIAVLQPIAVLPIAGLQPLSRARRSSEPRCVDPRCAAQRPAQPRAERRCVPRFGPESTGIAFF